MKRNSALVSSLDSLANGLILNASGQIDDVRMKKSFSYKTNNLFRKDEWEAIDRAVIDVIPNIINGVADLRAKGLIRNLGSLGITIDQWELMSDITDAHVDMAAVTRGEDDVVGFDLKGVPIPIIHKGWALDIRRLLQSRMTNTPLDTTMTSKATRKVLEKMEDILFNGYTSITAGGYTIYGYTSLPQRNFANISDWKTTPANILTDVEHLIQILLDQKFRGKFMLYVDPTRYSALIPDYSTYKDGTYLDRIRAYDNIDDVKVTDMLTADEVVLVSLTRETVDLSIGQDIMNVPWSEQGGLRENMKVLMAGAPRVKYDDDENCGIVHAMEEAVSSTTTTSTSTTSTSTTTSTTTT